jgi:hypothetical protein
MKTVFTNDQLPHQWAHQTQSEGRNGNSSMFFHSDTIFSYGSHFPMATIHQHNGENVYFVTTRSYSVTTARHISTVRQSIPSSARVFFVYDPTLKPSQQAESFRAEVDEALTQVLEAKNKVSRAKRFGLLEETINKANEFFDYFDIEEHFSVPSDLEALRAERQEQLKQAAKLEAKRAAERKVIEAEQNAKRLAEAGEKIEKWRSGENVYLSSLPKTFLRINGDKVETSKGADFPLSHALLGLRLVESVIKSGSPYKHGEHSLHLGHYRIERIDSKGNVTAGCHYVEYDEIARIAGEISKASVSAEVA